MVMSRRRFLWRSEAIEDCVPEIASSAMFVLACARLYVADVACARLYVCDVGGVRFFECTLLAVSTCVGFCPGINMTSRCDV